MCNKRRRTGTQHWATPKPTPRVQRPVYTTTTTTSTTTTTTTTTRSRARRPRPSGQCRLQQNEQCGIPDSGTTGCEICVVDVTFPDSYCKSVYDDEELLSVLSMCGDELGQTGENSFPQCISNRHTVSRSRKRRSSEDCDYIYDDCGSDDSDQSVGSDDYEPIDDYESIYGDPTKCKSRQNPEGFECSGSHYLKLGGFMGGLGINHVITPDDPTFNETSKDL